MHLHDAKSVRGGKGKKKGKKGGVLSVCIKLLGMVLRLDMDMDMVSTLYI